LKDVETALVAYAKEQEHRKSLSEAVVNNRKAVDLAMKLYIAGKTDFLNVLTAQLNLYTSENALVQSISTVDTNLIALYKALGGGWEKDSVAPRPKDQARVGQSDRRSEKPTKKVATD
jgi:multidrug efflux system outer membrane protein